MGIDVTVIDDSDHVGWLASATRWGEIHMTSVSTMVKNVKNEIGDKKISQLNILDHGNKNGIQIGNDWISNKTLSKYQGKLKELHKHFESDGIVHLQHCNIGQDRVLLLSLAKIFGVSIYAGTGKHNPIYRFNFGDYVRADPDGTFKSDVDRP